MGKEDLVLMAGVSSYLIFLFGGWDELLMILVACVVMDYVMGVAIAAIQKKLSSKVGFRGIAKKMFLFFLVAVANFLDTLLWENHMIRDATILFYICNEVVSIIEHARSIGVPIPDTLKKGIELIKSRFKK
ncbi:phage holin family protein [Priestia koreensis]|uniref:phage holin family protein n=1 Tax=Priestia koreensis TaxID=284581 RepID=UPI001F56EC34|nr:phage holin family protein [Priestia koreensis]UNL84573.1 phage holin family protein [Priestia koreensis]